MSFNINEKNKIFRVARALMRERRAKLDDLTGAEEENLWTECKQEAESLFWADVNHRIDLHKERKREEK